MNCKTYQQLFTGYIDKQLSTKERSLLEEHLDKCVDCRRELEATRKILSHIDNVQPVEPSPALRQNFYSMLENEKQQVGNTQKAKEKIISISVKKALAIAAQVIVLLGIGIAIGWNMNQNNNQPQLTRLNHKIDQLSRQVHYASLNQPTASQRIKTINEINTSRSIDDKMLDALINTMNGDENVNVRLTAIYALSEYKHVPKVKEAFIESVEKQTDPLLQVTLINILITLNDSKVKPTLENIIENESIDNQVKEQARQGLSVQI